MRLNPDDIGQIDREVVKAGSLKRHPLESRESRVAGEAGIRCSGWIRMTLSVFSLGERAWNTNIQEPSSVGATPVVKLE